MKIFVDTNILIDVLTLRRDISLTDGSARFLRLKGHKAFSLCVSASSMATCFYFLEKDKDAAGKMRMLTRNMTVVDSTGRDFAYALDSGLPDLEDAMQISSAMESQCEVIVTRDKKGFAGSRLPVFNPEEFIAKVSL